MIQRITRFVFVAAGLLGGYAVARGSSTGSHVDSVLPQYYVIFSSSSLGVRSGTFSAASSAESSTRLWNRAEDRVRDTRASRPGARQRSASIVGLLVGSHRQPAALRLIQPQWLASRVDRAADARPRRTPASASRSSKRRDFAAIFPRLAPPELLPADERDTCCSTRARSSTDGSSSCAELGLLAGPAARPARSCSPSCRRSPTPPTTPVAPAVGAASTCSTTLPDEDASRSSRSTTPTRPQVDDEAHAPRRRRRRARWSPSTTT